MNQSSSAEDDPLNSLIKKEKYQLPSLMLDALAAKKQNLPKPKIEKESLEKLLQDLSNLFEKDV